MEGAPPPKIGEIAYIYAIVYIRILCDREIMRSNDWKIDAIGAIALNSILIYIFFLEKNRLL